MQDLINEGNIMKKTSLIILVSMAFSIESTFKVEGMKCQMNCAAKVKSQASLLNGVNVTNVDFEKGLLTVDYNDKETNEQEILLQLTKTMDYKFTSVNCSSNSSCKTSCDGKKDEKKQGFFKRIFSWI